MSDQKEVVRRPHVVAVVQARMRSTRMPGKVLMNIAGKPLLWHIVHRLAKASLIDETVIATSDTPADDAIAAFCAAQRVPCVRGSEDNLLLRFSKAAEVHHADIIVRVCSDSPFIEGAYIDHFITALTEQKCDYVLPDASKPNAHEGIDVFTRRGLRKLLAEAANDPVACEHVSGYFKLHPDFVPIAQVEPFAESDRAAPRVSIDTPADLAFVEAVYDRLEASAGEASLQDLLFLIEREPSLAQINAHVRQKAIAQAAAVALIRCDGGGRFGLGHVKRMIELARALRDREGIGVIFAVNGSETALQPILRAGFEAKLLSWPDAPLHDVVAAPDIIVIDCREGVSREILTHDTAGLPVVAVIDDISDRRLEADLAFYPPVPQVQDLSWDGSECTAYIGWQYALLGQQPAGMVHPSGKSSLPSVLVSMGGSDPHRLTLRMAQALKTLPPVFRARFVIGPGLVNGAAIARQIVGMCAHFETIEGADDLVAEYASADMALAAFGVTAYELAAYGVPSLYIGISPDHVLSASAFDAAGIGCSLGLASTLEDQQIADAVWRLLHDASRRQAMRDAGLKTIDGFAPGRIAALLAETLTKRRQNVARAIV